MYPLNFEPDDNGTLLVTCVDIPELATFGEDEPDACRRAIDAIEEALAARIAHREDIPPPSPAEGRPVADLPPLVLAKVALYQAFRSAKLTKADLGRLLGWHAPQVDRLFDLNYSSKIEQIDQALRVLGKTLSITVRDAA